MKILKIFFAVQFALFALLQINDPDPLLWILIYGSMVAVSIMSVFHRYPTRFMIVMASGFLIMSVLYFDGFKYWLLSPDRNLLFDDLAKMQYPYIEEAREFLGLLICLAVLIFYFYLSRREEQK
ncbi:MAG TPA: transmembrane 220 family protein [Cyclobacteriaceae bacterium]|nr:transmembrane 220 family protein [Cyclobacteriaceae bacterium]